MRVLWVWGLLLTSQVGCGKAVTGGPRTTDADAGANADASDAGGVPRLVPWQLEAEGTASLVMGIFDTEQQVHCSFLPDETGRLRCLPIGPDSLTLSTYFSDPTCQHPTYGVTAAQGQAALGQSFAFPLPRQQCESVRNVVASFAVVPPNAPHYTGSPCAPSGAPSYPDYAPPMIEIVPQTAMPPETWVAGSEVDGPLVSQRLRLRQFAAANQPSFNAELLDERWGKACSLNNSTYRSGCWPENLTGRPNNFIDAGCTQPLWYAAACSDPAFIGAPALSGDSRMFLALGPTYSGLVHFSGEGGGCPYSLVVGNSSPETGQMFQGGAPLTGDIVVLPSLQPAGSSRLQLRTLSGDNGELVALDDRMMPNVSYHSDAAWRYHDSVANQDCSPIWTPEGLVRCVPPSVVRSGVADYQGYFTDAACTVPAYACSPDVCTAIVRTDVGANGVVRAVSLNSVVPLSGTVYVKEGECMPLAMPGYGALGAEAPWDDYPVLTEVNGRAPGAP